MTANTSFDLQWLAFRYAAGELPESEAAQFEHRLENEQAAREALASAVELGQVLAHVPARDWQAPGKVSRPRSRNWLTYAGWALVGAAACLAAVMVNGRLQQQHPATSPAVSPELAEAWGRSFDEFPQKVPSALAPTEDDLVVSESLEAEMSEGPTESLGTGVAPLPNALTVPSWMVAAVAKEEAVLPGSDYDDGDVRIE